jgi:hypothetical protein
MPLNLIGRSPQISRLREAIEKLKLSDVSVLLQGETGTGKEIVAHLIHNSKGKFVAVSCAALSTAIAEAEFFGVCESIVGVPKSGLLAAAEGGTILLDEWNLSVAKLNSNCFGCSKTEAFSLTAAPYADILTCAFFRPPMLIWQIWPRQVASNKTFTTTSVPLLCACRLCANAEGIFLS